MNLGKVDHDATESSLSMAREKASSFSASGLEFDEGPSHRPKDLVELAMSLDGIIQEAEETPSDVANFRTGDGGGRRE